LGFRAAEFVQERIVTSDISRIGSMGWEAVVGRDVNEVGAAESAAAALNLEPIVHKKEALRYQKSLEIIQ
jgi:hypothetical protein